MKRLFLFAAAAASLMAISCQKTYVVDEVNTPIGFSADLGKQTKAIMDGAAYETDHTFGVFAYALTENKTWESDPAIGNVVMDNVEIEYQTDVWRATNGTKYYWPNNAQTKLNFFAYAPYSSKLGCTVEFTLPKGISLTGYTHSDFTGATAVDFMVADDVKDMQYKESNRGVVPTEFNHKMTQVCFVIKKEEGLGGATFTLTSLKLKGINNRADFNAADNWSGQSGDQEYATTITEDVITEAGISPDPVTMIPQTLADGTQQFEIVYKIEGPGFANETVTRTFDINDATVAEWTPNMKVTYTLTVKMNEITFEPSVAAWSETPGSADVPNVN